MGQPFLGVSIMPHPDFLKATLPLFQDGYIEAVEWSFDTLAFKSSAPKWLNELLRTYANNNRLLGHGVYYSFFDARWTKRQEGWLKNLKKELKRFSYNHISEHFGFMSNSDYHKGCPFPVPLNNTTLAIGIDRLQRLQQTAQLPVGIENLAFSFTKKDVQEQGEFIQKLIAAVNGFVILDLHNIYCQAQNFDIDMMDLINCYPLDAVKEIHISGGSWQKSRYKGKTKRIRRDTHDGNIPYEIVDILPLVLARCKYVEFVIFERLGNTFKNPTDFRNYQKDFMKLKSIINGTKQNFEIKKWGKEILVTAKPLNDLLLYKEQDLLCQSLLTSANYSELISKVNLLNWDVTTWDPEMIDTAIKLSKKWNKVH